MCLCFFFFIRFIFKEPLKESVVLFRPIIRKHDISQSTAGNNCTLPIIHMILKEFHAETNNKIVSEHQQQGAELVFIEHVYPQYYEDIEMLAAITGYDETRGNTFYSMNDYGDILLKKSHSDRNITMGLLAPIRHYSFEEE